MAVHAIWVVDKTDPRVAVPVTTGVATVAGNEAIAVADGATVSMAPREFVAVTTAVTNLPRSSAVDV